MAQINLKRREKLKHPNTCHEFISELHVEDLEKLTNSLVETSSLINDSRFCIIYGYGNHPKRNYQILKNTEGVEVIWDGTFSPWWLKPLSFFAASHGGLIKIHDINQIPFVFTGLSNLAMVELYSFKKEILNKLISFVKTNRWLSFPAVVIMEDDSYFCLGANGDYAMSKTGILGWSSFGKNCPPDLIEFTKKQFY